MAKFISNGTNLTLVLGIDGQLEYLNVDLTVFPNITLAEIIAMDDVDAQIYFSGVNLTDEEKTINNNPRIRQPAILFINTFAPLKTKQ